MRLSAPSISMGFAALFSSVNHFAASSVKVQTHARSSVSSAPAVAGQEKRSPEASSGQPASPSQTQLTLSDEALLQLGKLKARDMQVRQHEAAHLAAAGGLATSGASFTYQKGPDGVSYAIGGEVGIDLSPGRTPQETIERARRIRAAALAPADPSGQDLAVAAQAQQLEQQAHGELAQQQSDPSRSTPDQRANVVRAYSTSDGMSDSSLSLFA